ncbi:MAG: hypothetical protein FWF60_08380 [Oscillospiraceae bacterium]|nr:hypothetical protein [Oscillospiraceae bacterium]
MKKFAALLLVSLLLGLSGCGGAPAAEETTVPVTTTQGPTTEPGPLPEHVWYPYTEFDASLRPGLYSLNELTERYGEPTQLFGEAVAPEFGVLGIDVAFEGVRFELWDSYDGTTKLSYNQGEGYDYRSGELTDADRALPLELARVTVTGGGIPLPRGIRVGDSLAQVRAAYPAGGYERPEGGGLTLSYNYYSKADEALCEAGGYPDLPYGVAYYFDGETLTQASVSWFNAWERFD